jgi:hypothetical protein
VPDSLLKKDKDGKALKDAHGNPVVNPSKFKSAARKAIKAIGYEQDGFHWKKAKIDVLLHPQSADIAQGVDEIRQQGRGCRRPGHHVRLCLPRDAGAHAGADLLRAQDPREPDQVPQGRREAAPASSAPTPRARSPSATRTASRSRVTQIVLSTQHLDEKLTSGRAEDRRAGDPRDPARGPRDRQGLQVVARQPHRQVRHRRSGRRRRPDRPQDHRRHLRRRGAPRRRRLLRQGPDQGRPLGRLCRALPRQERGRRQARRALHHPALLCHRRRQAAVDLCRPARHRQGRRRRGEGGEGAGRGHGPLPARHPRASRPQQGRSMPAPPPTATSAARPRATAASPGRRPTSSPS